MGEVSAWRKTARWAHRALQVLVAIVLFSLSVDAGSDQATRIVSAIYLSAGCIYLLLSSRLRTTS